MAHHSHATHDKSNSAQTAPANKRRSKPWPCLAVSLAVMFLVLMGTTKQLLWLQRISMDLRRSLQGTPQPECTPRQPPPAAMLMVIVGHESSKDRDRYWLAVANRRAYALQHGFPLYLVPGPLGSSEHPAWQKLVALQAVFQHSRAPWVWMFDADAFIMNMGLNVLDLANNPLRHRHPKHPCNSSSPDIIAAGACLTRINTGSVLWRNNNWTRAFVSGAWHAKHVARPAIWWDQAGILHMYKQGDSQQHVCIVKQRAINAYPNTTGCTDGTGTFKEGDLLVHFPGNMKAAIANISSSWLQAVPLLPLQLPEVSVRAPVYTVLQHKPGNDSSTCCNVHVSMQSALQHAHNSTQQVEFDLCIAPQTRGFDNWGWPVSPEPAQHKARLQQQLLHLEHEGRPGQESQQ